MGDPSRPPKPSTSSSSSSSDAPPPPPPPPAHSVTLIEPSTKKAKQKPKVFRVFRNVLRSFPIINTPACKLPSLPGGRLPDGRSSSGGGARITGTLFGYRKGRISLSVQESPGTLPVLVLELAMQTHVFQKELSLGMVRIALECEKRAERERTKLLEEPLWTMYCNGKKNGYAARREAGEDDLHVMEVLKAVSMGAGVLPMKSEAEGADGEMAYMRAHFDRVVGSKDSETLYMLTPDGSNNGPDLSIFFVRI